VLPSYGAISKPCSGKSFTEEPVLDKSLLFAQTDLSAPEAFDLVAGQVLVFTHRSPIKETVNEDCAALIPYDDANGVLVIADGLGGLPSGSTASNIAVQRLKKSIEKAAQEQTPLREAILDGIERANQDILAQGSGAATTIAVVEIQHDRMRPYHVGDSMILLCGQRGKKKLVSVAHSPVGYAVESGMLDVDEAVHHEERHIVSNVVGAPDMRIEIGAATRIAMHDTLILASDGLFDNLYLDEIIDLIRKGDLHTTAQRLLELTRQRMNEAQTDLPSHPDDLTFILYRRKPNSR
jgi:serine/threonine protein phosphatase PrpC